MARVLIVEDDRNTLSGLVEILSQEGYDVEGVDGARKALKKLGKEQYEVLLTDLKMPAMDGMTVIS